MPTCKRCNGVGPAESWGRYERDGQLRKLCPECEAKGKAERGIRKCASCGATSADRSDWGRYERNGRLRCCARAATARTSSSATNSGSATKLLRRPATNGVGPPLPSTIAYNVSVLPPSRGVRFPIHAAGRTRAHRTHGGCRPPCGQHQVALGARVAAALSRLQIAIPARHGVSGGREGTLAGDVCRPEARRDSACCCVQAGARRTQSGVDRRTEGSRVDVGRRQHYSRYHRPPEGGGNALRLLWVRVDRKQTDHMVPLVLAGEHSLRNIVIVCPPCNGRKSAIEL